MLCRAFAPSLSARGESPEAAVPLCVEFIKQQGMNVEPLGTERVSREHPVERVRRLVDDGLPAVDYVKVTRKRRRGSHHRRSFPVYDACLLTVASRSIALGTCFPIEPGQIECEASQRCALALLFRQLDVPHTMLPRAVWVQPAKEFPQHMMLPRQQRERLAGVLALTVPQHLLKEVHDTLVLCLAFGRELTPRGA